MADFKCNFFFFGSVSGCLNVRAKILQQTVKVLIHLHQSGTVHNVLSFFF